MQNGFKPYLLPVANLINIFTIINYDSRVMRYFPVRYDSRVIIYEREIFMRLATGYFLLWLSDCMMLAGVKVHERRWHQ